ncbi:hypothetical protein [Streptomyces chartreusis]|uniref:hypothetical protein n=1 Tax=Streptomyces chartreusis TaxID=1969 RepID=UPI0036644A06
MNDYTLDVRATNEANLHQGWDVHRLTLEFEVTARDEYPAKAPFLASGSLWASDLPGPERWIGSLHLSAGPFMLQPFKTRFTLETAVTDLMLRGLEKARAGGDLTLRAYLVLTGLRETQRWPAAADNEIIRIPHLAWSDQIARLSGEDT